GGASPDMDTYRTQRDSLVIDALVGVCCDEHVVGAGADHGTEHLPMRGTKILAFVDDDMAVSVVAVPHTGAVIHHCAPPTVFPLRGVRGLAELRVAFHLETGGALSSLAPRLVEPFVQPRGELLKELPHLSAFGTCERTSSTSPTSFEVGLPGAEGLPQDDLLPLLEEEISGPPFLIEFGQQLTQNRESSAVFDARLGFSRPLVLVQDPGGQLIDMGDINTCDQCGVHQRGQTGTQVHSEVLGEGRQEDRFVVSLPKPLGKVLDPVQSD